MNKNETLTLWLSVGMGLFAVMLIYSYTQDAKKKVSEEYGKQTTVVTAKTTIPEMQTVQEEMLEVIQVPEKFLQPGAATSVEDIVGLVALAPIRAEEQILKNKVIKPGIETGLSLQITPGKRAFTLPVSEVNGVAKLLKPGDRIDIIGGVSVGKGSGAKEKYVKVLLQDVTILATGVEIVHELPRVHQELGGEDYIVNTRKQNDFNSITVEVDLREAQKLAYLLYTNRDQLYFALRHPADSSISAGKNKLGTSIDQIIQVDTKRTPAANQRGR